MKYWELFFMTTGAGLLVGAVITPQSWLAVPLGFLSAIGGYALHYFDKENRK